MLNFVVSFRSTVFYFMKKAKVLFVSQEITPYVEANHHSTIGRYLPQGIQEKGKEIRTFMPRYGLINERRNQLHEVIRLSGMNIIIDDTDHPLIIKVASIQSCRMQVYFIDNEEYFQRKAILKDADGTFFPDNDERSIFFCRGVIETVKKLGWAPDIIHCNGWMTAPLPILIKKVFREDPIFADTKVVYTLFDDEFQTDLNKKFGQKLQMTGIHDKDIEKVKTPSHTNLSRFAMDFSDGVIQGSAQLSPELQKYMKSLNKPTLGFQDPENYIGAFNSFYDSVMEESTALVE